MPLVEQIKKAAEAATGIGRPRKQDLPALVMPRAARLYRFEDDGKTPNNRALPLVIYRGAVRRRRGLDPAAIFEILFAAQGWKTRGATASTTSCTSTRGPTRCWALPAERRASSSAATAGAHSASRRAT